MSSPIDRMKALMNSLPKRDISLGTKFLLERDFNSLKELIDSAIYKVKKNLNSQNPREEYLEVDLENLNRLKSEVDIYLAILEPDNDKFEEYVEEETIEEFY